MKDPETLKEIKDALYKQRDAADNLPELEELEFVKHLNEENQNILSKVFEYVGDSYTVMDVCGYAVGNLIGPKGKEQ